MYTRIMRRYFSVEAPKFIKKVKAKRVKKKKVPEKKIELPQNLEEAVKFKQDYDKSFPNSFDPEFVEKCWQDWWEKKKFFEISAEEGSQVPHNKRYVNILPPPNVTGRLHIGHALTGAIEDCLVRWRRMSGYKVLYIPGVDHAGIATQSVVERKLAKQNISKYDLGREEFVKKIWEWKNEYGNTITNQLRRIGSSFDWSRFFFTMDEPRSESVKEAFYQLFKKGLIYRSNRLINLSCALSTAISDIEVEKTDIKAFQKVKIPGYEKPVEFGVMVDFAYKVKDSDQEIVVSTTRIETMLGDVAVAVNSKDPRYEKLVGKELIHPFLPNRKMKVIVDDELVDMEFGTGAVKVTPAHDPNDFLCGKRQNLEFINILNDDGTMNNNCGQFSKMKRYHVREKIIEELQKKGLYKGKKGNPMSLGFCQRSGDVIEQVLKPQWYVDCQDISKKMIEVVENGELLLHPDNHNKTWYHFMKNSQDWCISRQLWWGHQIPAYKAKFENGSFAKENGEIRWFVGRSKEEANEEASKSLNQKFELIQDEDVLDTWFSSALLPFSCVGWPNKESLDFKTFFPNHVLETGYDILFFWVARMVMMSLLLVEKLPFKNVILHNIVRTETGEKMSKSKGNVIDPLEIIDGCTLEKMIEKIENSLLPENEKVKSIKEQKIRFKNGIPRCGSDALRYSLLSYVYHNKDINLDVNIPIRDRQFCNKIWNSFKLVKKVLGKNFKYEKFDNLDQFSDADRWIINEFHLTIKNVNENLEQFKFGHVIQQISSFYTHNFCDFYLEYSKNIPTQSQSANTNKQTLFYVMENFLRLLHPMMPYLSEELYQKLGNYEGKSESICIAQYPIFNEKFVSEENGKFFKLIDLVKELRACISSMKLPKKSNPKCYLNSDLENEKLIQKNDHFIRFLTGLGEILIKSKKDIPKECIKGVTKDDISFNIYIKGLIDATKEIKTILKNEKKLSGQIWKLEKKMKTPNYLTKVPENVRNREIDILQKNKEKLESLIKSKQLLESLLQII